MCKYCRRLLACLGATTQETIFLVRKIRVHLLLFARPTVLHTMAQQLGHSLG